MTYAMMVLLPTKPGMVQAVLDLLGPLIDRVRREEGCLAFTAHVGDKPDCIWLYEAWITQKYHDEIHEAYPEVIRVLTDIPALLSSAPTFHHGSIALTR